MLDSYILNVLLLNCLIFVFLLLVGYDVYLVGGCVRDLILKKTPKDFDIITSAELKEVTYFYFIMFLKFYELYFWNELNFMFLNLLATYVLVLVGHYPSFCCFGFSWEHILHAFLQVYIGFVYHGFGCMFPYDLCICFLFNLFGVLQMIASIGGADLVGIPFHYSDA